MDRSESFLSRLMSKKRVVPLRQPTRDGYDRGSGQVFTESTCKVTSMLPSWVTATTGSRSDVINFKNQDAIGTDSLEMTAARSILANLHNLDYETLACVPWTVGKKIWRLIKKTQLESLRTWRMFVCAYPEEREAFNQDIHKISLCSSEHQYKLFQIIKHITAPNFEWITHLTIQDSGLSKAEWTNLSKVRNLGALLILGFDTSNLSDRVLRSWSEEARENNAWSKLRVLIITNETNVTSVSFSYLSALPALTLCNFSGCGIRADKTEAQGWRPLYDTPLAHELNTLWVFSSNVFKPLRQYYLRAASPYTLLTLPFISSSAPLSSSPSTPSTEDIHLPTLSVFRRAVDHTHCFNTNNASQWFLRAETKTMTTTTTTITTKSTTKSTTTTKTTMMTTGPSAKSAPPPTKPAKPAKLATSNETADEMEGERNEGQEQGPPAAKRRKVRGARERKLEDVLGAFGV